MVDPTPVIPATLLVMAGGRATRFGSDKLAARLGSGGLLAHVLERTAPWFADTVVVHAPGPNLDLARLGTAARDGSDAAATGPVASFAAIRQVADTRPGGGPLVGLASGLAACDTDWAFVVGGDMPFVSRELVDRLWRHTEPTPPPADAPPALDVVIVRGPRGLEPLCAFFKKTCFAPAQAAIEAGERRVISFFDDVTVVEIDEAAARAVDPDLRSFFNINTVGDLSAARAALDSASPEESQPR